MNIEHSVAKLILPNVGRMNEQNRENFLEKTLRALPAGSRILDVGAGAQIYRKYCGHLRYVSQDREAPTIDRGDDSFLQMQESDYKRPDIVSDIVSIPEPDSSFDAVMCVEVLEHIPHPVRALQELARLIKPGGDLILTAPFCSLTHGFPYHFVSGFGKHWYEKHLPAAGLRITEMTANGNFFEHLAQEIKRVDHVARRYSQDRVRFFDKLIFWCMLRMLLRFSSRDTGSSELLCFGWHVLARKQEHV